MPKIYLLSSSDIYSKILELAINKLTVSYKIIKSLEELTEIENEKPELVIIDDEFNDDVKKYVNIFNRKSIPVIFLKDIFSQEELEITEKDKIKIIEKPFDEKDLINAIKEFIELSPQKKIGEKTMVEEKKISQEEDVLELTDIVEEKKKDEISDILSVKKDNGDKVLDDFFKEEDINISDKEEPVETEETLKEDAEKSLIEEVEEVEEPEKEEISLLKEPKEEIKIPVDEETVELAKEIEEEIKPTEEAKEIEDETRPKAIKEKESKIDFSKVEVKLLDATDRIMEAIEEATVEIAKAIAKVTPKIIEEVAKEIIPAVAKKIIAEEISKKEEEN